jgi:hypothetical protein
MNESSTIGGVFQPRFSSSKIPENVGTDAPSVLIFMA